MARLAVRNADTIRVDAFDTEPGSGGPIALPELGPGWCWIGIAGCPPRSVRLSLEDQAVSLALDHAKDRPSCLAAAEEPFRPTLDFTALDTATDTIECCVATLPEILAHLLDAAGDSLDMGLAISDLLERAIAGLAFDFAVLDAFAPAVGFDILRGCILVTRHLSKFSAEVALIEQATTINPSASLTWLLSLARANAQDYDGARIAARAAIAADPAIAGKKVDRHLAELDAHGRVMEELHSGETKRRSRGSARIAYCAHNALPYEAKGYAMRSHGLAKALVNAGRDIIVIARPGFPSDGAQQLSPSGLEIVDGLPYLFENGFGRHGRAYGYIAEAADYFERVFAAREIGIVQAASNFWTGLPAGIAARRLGLPFIYEVRSFWDITREAREPGFRETPQARRDNALEAETLALADRVLTLNGAMRDQIVDMGVPADRVAIVANSVDPAAFAPAPRPDTLARRYGIGMADIVIGYAGAILAYEGLDLLIEAARPLLAERDDVKLLIVGAQPSLQEDPASIEARLARQIEAAGLEGRAILAGRAQPDEMAAHYALFDICAYPRRALEVCELVSPLKPLEALAAGKAVVLSGVGGMRDMVADGETGLVHPPGDVPALRAALTRLAEDPALRAQLGEAARAYVADRRSWQAAAQGLQQLYDELA
ncbi:glycosyltransferase family 4 protein [Parasphingopyxis marina]|uniref:Glycosyltransferase n=1 Tax=Parasphingopyxis marina TaxID=2761622 RepID=A0A842HZ59_9SPHN|nr:glycosyltransferase family 4 protein [Parasphingopyxis marina]MBC2778466.1 glycosyltransferase [Parasphingopyxis marina]